MMKRYRRMIHEEKRPQQIKQENIELVLKIFQTFTIDVKANRQGPDYHRVMAWTHENQYGTQVVKSFNGFSSYKQQLVIPLDYPVHYLYIEVLKGACFKDPGTSNGTTVLGRAKIKLPPLNSCGEFSSRANLVGLNSSEPCVEYKGTIELAMKLHRYVPR